MAGVELRRATDADGEFLFQVYAGTRAEEMALVDWTEAEKQAFVRQQFEAQSRHYREYFTRAEFLVIERDGRPVGRLYLDRRPDEIRIVDISLLPHERNTGAGSALLRDILAEGKERGVPVSIHVEQFNRAMNLYRRLGFVKISDYGIYDLMEWRPEPAGAPSTPS